MKIIRGVHIFSMVVYVVTSAFLHKLTASEHVRSLLVFIYSDREQHVFIYSDREQHASVIFQEGINGEAT
jgi:hypothetical protein